MKKPRDPAPMSFPRLEDFEPYRELAEKLAKLEAQELDLQNAERRLETKNDDIANQRRSGGDPGEIDLDVIDAVLAGGGSAATPEAAARIDLQNARGKLVAVRRAIERVRIELYRIRNAASNELLPLMTPEYLKRRRRVVFALCELSETNENLWEMGDELSRRGFAHQHIFQPGRMFERRFFNLNTSTSAASKFLIEEVADGIVTAEEVEKFVRSPVPMDRLRAAEKEHKRSEKTT